MRHTLSALVLSGSLLLTTAAWAETTYVVDKINIIGSKTVPTEKLYSAIQSHKGSKVTQADIVADQDAISKVLGDANVVGGIKTSMATKSNKHIEVTFAITDQGAQAPVVTHTAPTLHAEIFDGNKSIPSDKLAAASGLNPGDKLNNDKILSAQKAIAAAYTAAKLPVNIALSGDNRTVAPGQVDVTWHIVETKVKGPKSAKGQEKSQEAQDQIAPN